MLLSYSQYGSVCYFPGGHVLEYMNRQTRGVLAAYSLLRLPIYLDGNLCF